MDDKKAKRRMYNTSMTASDFSKLRCNTVEREDESGEFTLFTPMYINLQLHKRSLKVMKLIHVTAVFLTFLDQFNVM